MCIVSRRVTALAACLLAMISVAAQANDGWTGNMVLNPNFEEDFVNIHGEGHVLSFKGDWYYNQADLIPDYWKLTKTRTEPINYEWIDEGRGGGRALRMKSGVATQTFQRAMSQVGGGAWGGVANNAIPMPDSEKPQFAQPWRAQAWIRGNGSITLSVHGGGSVTASASDPAAVKRAESGWRLVEVVLPADQCGSPASAMNLSLSGPGDFDDITLQEQLSPAPNLASNASFESASADGYPAGWSQQQKWRFIGPTYYVWTDWNHTFRENRGAIAVDPLVSYTGNQSLRMDVLPGDEKFIESDLIPVKQDVERVIEVGVFVRADKIHLLDIRCVDQDGIYMPAYRPRQPEYYNGGSFTFGNGDFEWRYVRKFFGAPQHTGEKLTAVRVRLCARGMNANTIDDTGTRPYTLAVGTVWWDDLRVTERTSTAAMLKQRGVPVPRQTTAAPGAIAAGRVDLGERFWGENDFTYNFKNAGPTGEFQLRLTTTIPGAEAVVTLSKKTKIANGQPGTLVAPYVIDQLIPYRTQQGSFNVELLKGGSPTATSTYAFNTWPVVVDIDVSRSYNLPNENPVSVSMNFGVAKKTIAKTAKVTAELFPLKPILTGIASRDGTADQADPAGLTTAIAQNDPMSPAHLRNAADRLNLAAAKPVKGSQNFANLPKAFQQTIASLPPHPAMNAKNGPANFKEFNLTTPHETVDRTNLIIAKFDLGALKVWPHDYPVRDTVLVIRGFDSAGNELFREVSDPFGRMNAPPAQEPIKEVVIRAEDDAVLINGKPRYLTGATHQNFRTRHSFDIIAQLGMMGHRLTGGKEGEFDALRELWNKYRLYALQIKPVSGMNTVPTVYELTPEQREAFQSFVNSGGMQNVVTINTGGWETTPNLNNPELIEKHKATNAWVKKTSKRLTAISTSGAYNAWWLPKYPFYDVNHAETEMWGPMDFNVVYQPYMRKAGRSAAWVYLPQLYDNHHYEKYRFETYENILRGSVGVSMIQGIGDPTLNRGLSGELRYLEAPLNSLEPAPALAVEPLVSHKITKHKGKLYVLATNAGPIQIGRWKWSVDEKASGRASHEGDTVNDLWYRPNGLRIHGFRGMSMPPKIQAGDKIIQHVWIDPNEKPDWAMLAVRGDGKFIHNVTLGNFNWENFRAGYGNIVMFSELNHSVWHDINWAFPPETWDRATKIMGTDKWAPQDNRAASWMKNNADTARKHIDEAMYQPAHFHNEGKLPSAGQWVKMELDAEELGLVGKLVDGFAYLTGNGRALWDYTALQRDGKIIRVFSEDSVGIDRQELDNVRFHIAGLGSNAKVKVLFEERELPITNGSFVDSLQGIDTYGDEAGAVVGDMFGFVKDPDRELPRMMPSGYGYAYGPTAVRIYEITPN